MTDFWSLFWPVFAAFMANDIIWEIVDALKGDRDA